MSTGAKSSGLVRSLSLSQAVMIGVASMIGGAIFVLVGPGIDAAGPALIIAFLLNGVITLFTALTYAELGSALPATGGGYKWVREGLPRPNSYLSGWMAWFAHTIAGSLYAVAFGTFLGHLLKSAEIIDDAFGFPLEKLFAVIAIAIFTFINVRGSSHTGKVGSAITFTQLLIIGVLIIAALVAMSFTNPNWPENFRDFLPNGTMGLVLAMGLTFIAFEGYEIIAQAGDEIKRPKKNIPRAIFISLGIVISVYVVFAFVFIGGLDPSQVGLPAWEFIGGFGELGIIEAAEYYLPFGALIVLAGGFVSTLAALNATTFAASRVSFAMGRNHDLPPVFNRLHKKYRTPFVSTIFSSIVMIVLALSFDLTMIALAASVMFLFLFAQVNVACITIRRLAKEKKLVYGFKTPFFPLVPVVGFALVSILAVYLLFSHPLSWVIAIVWIGIGFLIYKFYTSKKEIQHHAPLVFNQSPEERKEYRILVVFDKRTATKLTKLATAMAAQKDGEISFLNVISVPKQTPLVFANKSGETGIDVFDEFKKSISHSIRHRYLVRLSHDPTEAILATAEEQEIDTIIVNFSFLRNNRRLLSLSTCDIIGVTPRKNFGKDISNIIISYDKGRHSNLGLEIAGSMAKEYNSKIRIVRGITQSPDTEVQIVNKINEIMFELDIKKMQFEKVYPKTENMLVSSELLKNFNKVKTGVLILGAGNQADAAFSPKTLELADKSKKTVFIVRNHLFSEFHTRSFWNVLLQIIKENKILYRIYIEILASISLIKSKQKIGRYDEEYFDTKF
jgi:amino acid transporter/nucleotide-binding universal stress UspA family protein